MKIRNIESGCWKRHIKTDSKNIRKRKRMLRKSKATGEQLELAKVCIKLDKMLMRFATKQLGTSKKKK